MGPAPTNSALLASCSLPASGKVAPPRNEAETDGAGTHQLKLYARVERSPCASTQSGLGTSPLVPPEEE